MKIVRRLRGIAVLLSLAWSLRSRWRRRAVRGRAGFRRRKVPDVKIHMMNGDNDGLESGKGWCRTSSAGAPPKRVALVSFYIWDSGTRKRRATASITANTRCRWTTRTGWRWMRAN